MTIRGRFPYTVWPGHNRFVCRGRCITGPDQWGVVATAALVLVPSGLYVGIPIPYLLENRVRYGIAGLVVFLMLFAATLACLVLTALDDPGILPRQQQTDITVTPNMRLRLPRRKAFEVDGMTEMLKYCETCQLYRPPRCSHCSTCNNCVERFDHHCPWVSNCVGRRNYRTFYLFVVSCCLLCLFVFAWTILYFVFISQMKVDKGISSNTTAGFANALSSGPTAASLIIVIIAFFGAAFTGALSVFHTMLIWTNKTTAESFKYTFGGEPSPYQPKGARNWLRVVCSRKPPSKVKVGATLDGKTRDMIQVDWRGLAADAEAADYAYDDGRMPLPTPEEARKLYRRPSAGYIVSADTLPRVSSNLSLTPQPLPSIEESLDGGAE
ncbi:hypothetical protein CDCA_CDCA02G0718 [Cyanidium caldarium]|uniref:Palmitoyltransferase n=1 Tax=Cyanidium caldarium TaxID=2771 RepID=A0AAV9IS04_CYACA|nr:hypothetical protein CDCA_CDCA02G0718 [Cyanidium caldarium]